MEMIETQGYGLAFSVMEHDNCLAAQHYNIGAGATSFARSCSKIAGVRYAGDFYYPVVLWGRIRHGL
jgi:hypothetical protein